MRIRFGLAAAVSAVAITVGGLAWGEEAKDPVKEFFWYQCYICHVANDPYDKCTPERSRPSAGLPGGKDGLAMTAREPGLPEFIRVQNAHGPDLCGVFGQPAGRRAKSGYQHSPPFLENAAGKIVWTEEALDAYLTDTRAYIPGAWMFVKLKDPALRKGIIEFLKTYK